MLINEMIKTLKMGGNVLLPVFATGNMILSLCRTLSRITANFG